MKYKSCNLYWIRGHVILHIPWCTYIYINWICQYCYDWKCFNDLAQFRWSLIVRTSMLCIQVGVLVSETFIFCDYRCFFPLFILWPVVSTWLRFSRVTVSCSWVCWWGSSGVKAQNAPGRKVCHHVLSRGWQVFFLRALAHGLLAVCECVYGIISCFSLKTLVRKYELDDLLH